MADKYVRMLTSLSEICCLYVCRSHMENEVVVQVTLIVCTNIYSSPTAHHLDSGVFFELLVNEFQYVSFAEFQYAC